MESVEIKTIIKKFDYRLMEFGAESM